MTDETLTLVRHIFNSRIDNAVTAQSYVAWTTARDVLEYALVDNVDALKGYDVFLTTEEQYIDERRKENVSRLV